MRLQIWSSQRIMSAIVAGGSGFERGHFVLGEVPAPSSSLVAKHFLIDGLQSCNAVLGNSETLCSPAARVMTAADHDRDLPAFYAQTERRAPAFSPKLDRALVLEIAEPRNCAWVDPLGLLFVNIRSVSVHSIGSRSRGKIRG